MLTPPAFGEALRRVDQALERLGVAAGQRIALAVSGGPDSLALLRLCAAARPGMAIAATVDHGLRAESRAEADHVAAIAAGLGVDHCILSPGWSTPPRANVQAAARAARYEALARWALAAGAACLATAHHLDDQAETVLMRLARGAGTGGLSGIRPRAMLPAGLALVRPLLDWHKAELEAVVAAAGWVPVRDPSNADPDYDRTRARALLAGAGWLDPTRLAAAAGHFGEAEQALAWTAARLFDERCRPDGADAWIVDAADLPRDYQRRLLIMTIARFGVIAPPGPKLVRLLDALGAGRIATLAGVRAAPGRHGWRLTPAPPRRPLASTRAPA